MEPLYRTARAPLRRALGGRALRGDSARSVIETGPEAHALPITRGMIRAGRVRSADALSPVQSALARAAPRVASASVARRSTSLAVPTIPRPRTLADEMRADPIESERRLGTYTNFVNLLDLCALAVPGRSCRTAFRSA